MRLTFELCLCLYVIVCVDDRSTMKQYLCDYVNRLLSTSKYVIAVNYLLRERVENTACVFLMWVLIILLVRLRSPFNLVEYYRASYQIPLDMFLFIISASHANATLRNISKMLSTLLRLFDIYFDSYRNTIRHHSPTMQSFISFD